MPDPIQTLRRAKSILLVDWSSPAVPRALIEAGFTVFTASPGRYSVVQLNQDDLIFRRLTDRPAHVDIVNVYRPENEHEAIVANHLIPLGAKILWLQPSIPSGMARQLALQHGFELVEGIDIAAAVR